MGYYKQSLIAEAKKAGKSKPASGKLTNRQRVDTLNEAFTKALPTLWDNLTDDWITFKELKVYRKPDDTLLALAVIGADDKEYIRFGTGDYILECLVGLNASLADRGWDESKKSKEKSKKKS